MAYAGDWYTQAKTETQTTIVEPRSSERRLGLIGLGGLVKVLVERLVGLGSLAEPVGKRRLLAVDRRFDRAEARRVQGARMFDDILAERVMGVVALASIACPTRHWAAQHLETQMS